MKSHYQILIVGGGTAGIMVAAQLMRKQPGLTVALIEPSANHWYQPAWTLVGAGTYDYSRTRRDQAALIPPGVEWIKDAAAWFTPENNSIGTLSSGAFTYDYLVVCPGVQMHMDLLPGLSEAMKTDTVCSNYTDPNKTWKVLQEFKGGNAVFTQASTPIKCGGAPQKIMYLAEEYFHRSGVRKKSNVIFATPGTTIFGIKDFADTLTKVITRKKIILKLFYSPVKIDAASKEIYFQYKGEDAWQAHPAVREEIQDGKIIRMPYDMLHLAPPQAPPAFIQHSPLAIAEGPDKGWIDVNHFTLRHKRYANIFALGDVAALPTAKTGAAVRKQAPVVVDHLVADINHSTSGKLYNGYSSCPVTTGYGKMMLAEFRYNNQRDSDPFLSKLMDTSKEHWSLWILKKYGLPYLYWNRMMKGKM